MNSKYSQTAGHFCNLQSCARLLIKLLIIDHVVMSPVMHNCFYLSDLKISVWHLQHVALFPTFALFVIDGRQKLHTPVRELTLKPVEAAAKETKERQQ